MVVSDGQTSVLESLQNKTKKAIELHTNLTNNVNNSFEIVVKEFNKEILKPKFI